MGWGWSWEAGSAVRSLGVVGQPDLLGARLLHVQRLGNQFALLAVPTWKGPLRRGPIALCSAATMSCSAPSVGGPRNSILAGCEASWGSTTSTCSMAGAAAAAAGAVGGARRSG